MIFLFKRTYLFFKVFARNSTVDKGRLSSAKEGGLPRRHFDQGPSEGAEMASASSSIPHPLHANQQFLA